MKLSIRIKLFVFSLALILIVVVVSGIFLTHTLRNHLLERVENELLRHAAASRLFLETRANLKSITEVDPVAHALSEATASRITVILEDGTVIGDSALPLEDVYKAPSHDTRPEVMEALEGGKGGAVRYSTTIEDHVMYVAVRFESGGDVGVVRASRLVPEINEALFEARSAIVIAGMLGLFLAVLFAGVFAHIFSRAFRDIVEYARGVAETGTTKRLEVRSGDEIGGLAGSLNKLAEQLEHHVRTLSLERDRFETVLEGMSEAVLALDEEQRVTLLNRAGVLLLGLSDVPVGRTLVELIRVPQVQTLVSVGRENVSTTVEFDLPGNRDRRVLARATELRSGGTVVVLLDVTELRRLERIRRDFVANVSHELRTPVSVIKANVETLIDGAAQDPRAAERFLNSTLANAERLAELISDLLDISKIEAGKYQLDIAAVDVGRACERAAESIESRAADRGITVETQRAETIRAWADQRALDQVLFNLVDNAVKYIPSGSHVRVSALQRGELARIEVADDGPGIEPNHRDRLFERFYRVDAGRSRAMGGTGLGLAIVKHLVTAMKGAVGMTAARPHGCVFWVELPSVSRTDASIL